MPRGNTAATASAAYEKCMKQRGARSRRRGRDGSKNGKGNNSKLCNRGYCTAKSLYKVFPSAYANGYAVQVCNGNKPDAKGVKRRSSNRNPRRRANAMTDLERWYAEKWVNVCTFNETGKLVPCGRKSASLNRKSYPYCRPVNKLKGTSVSTLHELTPKERKEMCRKKRALRQGLSGKPTRVYLS